MAETFRVGPGQVLTAASLSDPVEDWTDLGNTRGPVGVQIEEGHLAFGRVDQSGRTPRADSVSFIGHRVVLTFPMLDHELEKLQKIAPNAVLTESGALKALGLGLKGAASITPRAWSVVPEADYTAGSAWWDSTDTIWIPKGVLRVLGEWTGELPEGDDVLSGTALEVEVIAVDGGSDLDASVRTGGIGPIWVTGAGVLGLDLLWETDPDGSDTLDAATQALVGGELTVSRSSTATYWDPADDTLKEAAADTLRIEAEGALIEPQRTNKCQNNYLHGGATTGWSKGGDAAATLEAVTDATELAAAGLDEICSDDYVLKLDNSGGTGSATAIGSGTVGNTNVHAASAFVRGSGDVKVQLTTGSTDDVTLTSGYQRAENTVTPDGSSRPLAIIADPGAVVYFVLAQLEEGAVATNPIPNDTSASVTRQADSWTDSYTEAVDETNGVTAQFDFTPRFAEGDAQAAFVGAIGSTTDPRLDLRHTSGSAWALVIDDGTTSDGVPLDGDDFPENEESEVTFGYDPALADNWFAYDGDTDVTPATPATAAPSGPWGDSRVYLGRASNGDQLNGWIRRVALCRGVPAAEVADAPARLRTLTRAAS